MFDKFKNYIQYLIENHYLNDFIDWYVKPLTMVCIIVYVRTVVYALVFSMPYIALYYIFLSCVVILAYTLLVIATKKFF